MTRYFVDTSTYNDFDAVIRYLLEKKIPMSDRDKVRMVVSAELTDKQVEEIRALPLEESVSIGTTSLF